MNTTATASPDRDLMSRHQVAVMLRVTSALVARWARRGRLSEVRDETRRARYRRAEYRRAHDRAAPEPGAGLMTGGRPGGLCGGPDHPDWPLPPRRQGSAD